MNLVKKKKKNSTKRIGIARISFISSTLFYKNKEQEKKSVCRLKSTLFSHFIFSHLSFIWTKYQFDAFVYNKMKRNETITRVQ